MLVDITLHPTDAFQITRSAEGKTTLTIPLGVLTRAHLSYLAKKPEFDELAAKQPH